MSTHELAHMAIIHCGSVDDAIATIDNEISAWTSDPARLVGVLDLRDELKRIRNSN